MADEHYTSCAYPLHQSSALVRLLDVLAAMFAGLVWLGLVIAAFTP